MKIPKNHLRVWSDWYTETRRKSHRTRPEAFLTKFPNVRERNRKSSLWYVLYRSPARTIDILYEVFVEERAAQWLSTKIGEIGIT